MKSLNFLIIICTVSCAVSQLKENAPVHSIEEGRELVLQSTVQEKESVGTSVEKEPDQAIVQPTEEKAPKSENLRSTSANKEVQESGSHLDEESVDTESRGLGFRRERDSMPFPSFPYPQPITVVIERSIVDDFPWLRGSIPGTYEPFFPSSSDPFSASSSTSMGLGQPVVQYASSPSFIDYFPPSAQFSPPSMFNYGSPMQFSSMPSYPPYYQSSFGQSKKKHDK